MALPPAWTMLFDSGLPVGVNLMTDSFGNPTYGAWQQDLSIPFNVPDPSSYVVCLSKCTYRTPFGDIPTTDNKGKSIFSKKKQAPKLFEVDEDEVIVEKMASRLSTIEDGTAGVYVFINIVGATTIGGDGQKIVAYIPPPSKINDSGDLVILNPGSYPMQYVEQSTVVPWVPLNQNTFNQVQIIFASSNGTIIPTNDLDFAAPFTVELVIRKKADLNF